jgi:hypothetical protein
MTLVKEQREREARLAALLRGAGSYMMAQMFISKPYVLLHCSNDLRAP